MNAHQIELNTLFLGDNYHGYIGHASQVAQRFDFTPVAHDPKFLLWRKGDDVVQAFRNVCKHRFAILKEQSGNAPVLTCDLHGWTYGNGGSLIGTPKQQPPAGCHNLDLICSSDSNSFMFSKASSDIQDFLLKHSCDVSEYNFHKSYKSPCDYGWKAFIDTYSENYHVAPFHPGLGQMIDTSAVEWDFCDIGQVAKFKYAGKYLGPGLYSNLQEAYQELPEPPAGVQWFLFYPNLMVEFYPEAMVVSVVIPDPQDPDKSINYVDFFYKYGVAEFYPQVPEAFEKAYFETAVEDDEICRRLHHGRKVKDPNQVLFPSFNDLEKGQEHFNCWYQDQMRYLL